MAVIPTELSAARESFLTLVADIRPELHRYCARLVGSAIDGEDIVQDSLDTQPEPDLSPFRPRPETTAEERALLDRYAGLFNARNWDAMRGFLAEECRLDLVSKAARRGKQVSQYFGRYDAEKDIRFARGTADGRDVIAVYQPAESPQPTYLIAITWQGDKIALIRDYRYVPYLTRELAFVPT